MQGHVPLTPAANLLLSCNGVLKLADFGLARLLESADGRFTRLVCSVRSCMCGLLFGSLLCFFLFL
jgi:hypothetical protein